MLILPAIDLLQGRCVRLRQGRFDEATIYSDEPDAVARTFVAEGADALHVVDLEGARDGKPRNLDWIMRIRRAVPVTLQVGGGVRTMAVADKLLKAGVDRVVLGTIAAERPRLLRKVLKRLPVDRVAVSVDVRDGRLAIRGWTEESRRSVEDVLGTLREFGLRNLVCTDVNRDGILGGPSFDLTRQMIAAGFEVTVAGGVATAKDVRRVKESGAAGCIIGSALYTQMLSLRKALEAARAD